MKPYLLSLGIGVLVGIIYAMFGVRSPAPPVIALVGLLGILVGEQLPPLVKNAMNPARISWIHDQVKPHVFGNLPGPRQAESQVSGATSPASLKEDRHV
jgi:XapX domain-containing protein